MKQIFINNIEELNEFAEYITQYCKKDFYLLLSGDLGAGKTTFTKVLLKKLGVTENVTSPTFVIMNQYKTAKNINVNHVDAYRLVNGNDIEMYEEQFEASINIIEWYENMEINFDDFDNLKINIKIINENARLIEITERK